MWAKVVEGFNCVDGECTATDARLRVVRDQLDGLEKVATDVSVLAEDRIRVCEAKLEEQR